MTPCPGSPGQPPGPHRPAELSQQREQAQQLLVPLVSPPPRHWDPVGSLRREGGRWPRSSRLGRGAPGGPGHTNSPHETPRCRYLGREALDGVVHGHRLGQVPAQAGQVLPVAAPGAEAVPLGEAVPEGEAEPVGTGPRPPGGPQGGFTRAIT